VVWNSILSSLFNGPAVIGRIKCGWKEAIARRIHIAIHDELAVC
jgi:hypothetical protein